MSEDKFASFEAAEAKLAIDLGHENFLELTDLGLAIEAMPGKVVVVLDKFKSGYECPQCKGNGRIRSTLVEGTTRICDKCDGKGHILFIPDKAKSIATTGVVVSIGEGVSKVKLHRRVICTPLSGVALPMKGNIEIKVYYENEPLAYLHNINSDSTITQEMLDEKKEIIELDTTRFVEHDTPLAETSNA